MKKLVLFTLLLLLPTLATAQIRRDTEELTYGFKAAWNFVSISYSDIDENIKIKPQHKLAAGLFGMYRPIKNFAISVEMLYSQQGHDLDIPYVNENPQQADIGYTNDATLDLQYLNFPILINWYVPIVPGLAVKAGVQPGFLLESKFTYWGETINIAERTERVDVSIPIGLSYEFDFGLLFDVRYNIGLTNVITPNDNDNSLGDEAAINYSSYESNTNSVWQFALGFRF